MNLYVSGDFQGSAISATPAGLLTPDLEEMGNGASLVGISMVLWVYWLPSLPSFS